jgi:hypothetical protein
MPGRRRGSGKPGPLGQSPAAGIPINADRAGSAEGRAFYRGRRGDVRKSPHSKRVDQPDQAGEDGDRNRDLEREVSCVRVDAQDLCSDVLGLLALSGHVRQLRQADVPIPTEVDELAAFLTRSVRSRPEATAVTHDVETTGSPRMAERLLVTKVEAAELAGQLSTMPGLRRCLRIGSARLLRVDRAAIAVEAKLDGTFLLRGRPRRLSAKPVTSAVNLLELHERGAQVLTPTTPSPVSRASH